MRHLLVLPVLCTALAACATPAAPRGPQAFTLAPGQRVEAAPGVTLVFDSVDDSRCPPGVRCVWTGRLVYRFSIGRAGSTVETFTLSPGEPGATPAVLAGRRVVLDESSVPAPAAQGAVVHHHIRLTLPPA
ncbi:MAG: hypothetical protein V7631_1330 [Massilia sp.]|jgi:hypothetical protein